MSVVANLICTGGLHPYCKGPQPPEELQLETLGVIENQSYRGVRVRKLSMPDLIDTYRTRILLEGFLVRQAAQHFTRETQERALTFLDHQAQWNDGWSLEGIYAHTAYL